jgi:ABC-type antimicrobial peptide transport system permease subunit
VTIGEQRRELGILRALGLNSGGVLKLISLESLLTILASYGAGTSTGVILTMIFLIPDPIVTASAIVNVAVWLSVVFAATFVSSLYPAATFSKKDIVDMMSH